MKDRESLIRDADGNIIDQTWQELFEKINDIHGDWWAFGKFRGLGNIAADFLGLLTFHYTGDDSPARRMTFSRITADATTEADIKLLAKILAIMMIEPSATNIECGWFIYYLAEASDLHGFDAKRAALVMNELYAINDKTAMFLMKTLETYVIDTQKGDERICDLLRETGLLRKEFL